MHYIVNLKWDVQQQYIEVVYCFSWDSMGLDGLYISVVDLYILALVLDMSFWSVFITFV